MQTKIHEFVEKKGSTLILKAALVMMAGIAVVLCIFAVPGISLDLADFIGMPLWKYLIMAGLYAAAAAFFNVIYQSWTLLRYIDQNKAFTDLATGALKRIAYSATLLGAILLCGMPFAFFIANADDAPGLIIFAFVFASMPIAVGVFAALLKKLLQNAIAMKSENDLTV